MTALGLTEGAFHEAARRLQNKKKLAALLNDVEFPVRSGHLAVLSDQQTRFTDVLMRRNFQIAGCRNVLEYASGQIKLGATTTIIATNLQCP